MKNKIIFDARSPLVRATAFVLNSFFFLVNSGVAALFILLSLRVLTSDFGRIDSAAGYQWPLYIKILSAIYIVVAVALLYAQVSIFFGVSKSGLILVACLGVFFAVYCVEVFMGIGTHGLREFFSYEFLQLIVFSFWISLNYFFWLKRGRNVR